MTSYNILPTSDKKFQVQKAQSIIKSLVDNECSKIDYNEEIGNEFSEKLSIKIVERLRELEYNTYKYICNVLVGEKRGGGIQGTSKCFFDMDVDSSFSYSYIKVIIF